MSDAVVEELRATEVASYLRRHVGFLTDFPDLAATLVLPREKGKATSLASYQVDVLRDKTRELNRRLHELYQNANDNERLTVCTHQLTLALMRARTPADTLGAMVAALTEDFQSELVRVVLFRPIAGVKETEWLQVLPGDAAILTPFAGFRAGNEPLCGRLQPEKLDALFGARVKEVGSTALLPLAERGMVAIASRDPNRFFPGMGTLFLRLMAESLAVALARFDD